MPRCPNCWSGVDALAGDCPECGASLGRTSAGRGWRTVGAILLVAAAGVGGMLAWQRVAPTEDGSVTGVEQAVAARTDPVEAGDDRGDPEPDPAARAPRAHWPWAPPDPGTPPLVALKAGPRTLAVGALSMLPTHRQVELSGAEAGPRVLHADPLRDLVLLASDGSPPPGVEPRPMSTTSLRPGSELLAIAPDGSARTALVQAWTTAGFLALASSCPPGTVLLDASDAAVAVVRADGLGVPFAGLIAWLDAAPARELGELQAELRRQDPRLVLEDLTELLTGEPDRGRLREVIARASAAAVRATDRSVIEALGAVERDAYRMLVRDMTGGDAARAREALSIAREALARHPGDPGLLEDAALLAAAGGEAVDAATWFGRLRAIEPERAASVAPELADLLGARASELLRGDRPAEALSAFDQASALAPARADLLAGRARALDRVGRHQEAAAAAAQAAAIDASFRPLARDMAEALARANDPATVEIPFDPRTHVIRANVLAGGLPIDLVVDTGATTTTVPIRVADRLGIRSADNPRVRVQTASGTVEGEVVTLPTLTVGGVELRSVEAVALDLPGAMRDSGLLGMNALSHFRVEIDADRGVLVLTRRGGR